MANRCVRLANINRTAGILRHPSIGKNSLLDPMSSGTPPSPPKPTAKNKSSKIKIN